MLILFGTLAFFGCLLWFVWSLVIFNDPLYFMNSPYSAKSQQLSFLASGELPTYHNIFESIRYYVGAVVLNSSSPLFITALIGIVVYLFGKKEDLPKKLIVLGLLLSIFVFNVLALFLGISILFVPGITPQESDFQLFNIRYGMMMVPTLAILIGLLISRLRNTPIKIVTSFVIAAVVMSFAITQPITLSDGTEGLSARKPGTINKDFIKSYDYGYIAFDDFSRSANPVSLGIPMDKIIYVGSHPYWENMLVSPNQYARWLIIRHNDVLDRTLTGTDALKNNYKVISVDNDISLYMCIKNCTAPDFKIGK